VDQRDTLMIGDGANDSLAFNESFCTGTPAVDRGLLEHKADFYFLGRGLGGLRQMLEVARQRQRAGQRVVAFSILYNILAVALCLHGSMNPLVAAIIMPISSLISLALVFGSFRRS
jgi:Cu2+-exporting ATPase